MTRKVYDILENEKDGKQCFLGDVDVIGFLSDGSQISNLVFLPGKTMNSYLQNHDFMGMLPTPTKLKNGV